MRTKKAKYLLAAAMLAVFCGCAGGEKTAQMPAAQAAKQSSSCEKVSEDLADDLLKTCANVDGTMRISGEKFSLNFGCNQIFGEVEFLSENSLALRRVASTKMLCDDEANAREMAFSRALVAGEIFEFERLGDEIILRANNYAARLAFVRE